MGITISKTNTYESCINILESHLNRHIIEISMTQTNGIDGNHIQMRMKAFKYNISNIEIDNIQNQLINTVLIGSDGKFTEQDITSDVKKNITLDSIRMVITNVNMQQGIDTNGKYNIIKNFTHEETIDILRNELRSLLNKMTTVTPGDNHKKINIIDWLPAIIGIIIFVIVYVMINNKPVQFVPKWVPPKPSEEYNKMFSSSVV